MYTLLHVLLNCPPGINRVTCSLFWKWTFFFYYCRNNTGSRHQLCLFMLHFCFPAIPNVIYVTALHTSMCFLHWNEGLCNISSRGQHRAPNCQNQQTWRPSRMIFGWFFCLSWCSGQETSHICLLFGTILQRRSWTACVESSPLIFQTIWTIDSLLPPWIPVVLFHLLKTNP